MKINDILNEAIEGELIPRSKMVHADKLAKEFVDLAIDQFDNVDTAKKIADNFAKALQKEVDEQIKYRKMRVINKDEQPRKKSGPYRDQPRGSSFRTRA